MAPGRLIAGLASLALAACATAPTPAAYVPQTPLETALHGHVAVLASDGFGGRDPGTLGETQTLDYLQGELAGAGLASGTHDPGHPWREPFSYDVPRGTIATHNLIARLPGSEPQAGAVLLVAHWDHLGHGARCRGKRDDAICNGAVDNASGLAMLIEIARLLAKGPRPRRDIYFLATSGEEDGLRGASAFIADPPVPLEKFAAAFNLDTEGVAPAGGPAVVLANPDGAALEALIAATAFDVGVTLVPQTSDNAKFLRRQDGWAFEGTGVPAVMISAAFADGPRFDAYLARRYHRASDALGGVELGAAAEMVLFHTALLRRAADPDVLPRRTPSEKPASAP